MIERRTNKMRTVLFVVLFLNSATACTKSGWSDWINDYYASKQLFPDEKREPGLALYGGDKENMNATVRDAFCASSLGVITDIECVTAANGTSYTAAQAVKHKMSCVVANGFTCSNRLVVSGACLDYKIRFYCNCTNPKPVTNPRSTPSNKNNSSGNTPPLSTERSLVNVMAPKGSTLPSVVTTPANGAGTPTTGNEAAQGKQLGSRKNSAVGVNIYIPACFLLALATTLFNRHA